MINRPVAFNLKRKLLLANLSLSVLVAIGHPALSANEVTGTSSRKAKLAAMDSIPYQQLNQQTRNKISEVVTQASLYRRLPTSTIEIDPDHLVFLVRHPEVIVNIWRIMGVTRMKIDRTGPFSLWSDDGSGTVCDIELVYGTKDQHVYYCTGSYQGNFIRRKLDGQCVLVLNTIYQAGPDGKPIATNQLDVFLKIDNATVGLVAKTLNPIVGPTADHNFVESLKFLQRLNNTTKKNGPGVQRMAGRLTDIQPEIRQAYSDLAGLVYRRSRQAAQNASYPSSLRNDPPPSPYQPVPATPPPGSSSFDYGAHPGQFQAAENLNSLYPQPNENRMNRIPTYPIQTGNPPISQAGHTDQNYQDQRPLHQGSYRWANSAQPRLSQQPSYRAPQYPQQNYYWR